MAGDEASTPAVELTLGLSTISRQEYHAFRRREARMKQMRKTKFSAGNRRRLLSPAPASMRRPKNNTAAAIPVMSMQCAYPAVALHYMPCGGSPYGLPYVVPCWTTPVVGPVVDAESRAVVPKTAAAGKEGAGDEKSSSELLHFSGEENTAAVTCGSNETKAEKLFDESSSKNKRKGMEEKMPYVTAKGDGPEGKTITGFLYKYTKAEVSIICVCHGRSFSPAEFLRHAGNSHTSQPLRHIVVVSSPARSK